MTSKKQTAGIKNWPEDELRFKEEVIFLGGL